MDFGIFLSALQKSLGTANCSSIGDCYCYAERSDDLAVVFPIVFVFTMASLSGGRTAISKFQKVQVMGNEMDL